MGNRDREQEIIDEATTIVLNKETKTLGRMLDYEKKLQHTPDIDDQTLDKVKRSVDREIRRLDPRQKYDEEEYYIGLIENNKKKDGTW